MLANKLLEFHKNAPQIKLDKVANIGKFSYKYASLGGVLDSIRKPLTDLGISFYQIITTAGLKTVLIDTEDNDKIEFEIPMHFGDDVQLVGKQITYYRRYSLLTVLGIVGEEDTDGVVGEKENHSGRYSGSNQGENTSTTSTATEKQVALLKRIGANYTIGELGNMIGDEKMATSIIADKKISELRDEALLKTNKNKMSKILEVVMNAGKKEEIEEF